MNIVVPMAGHGRRFTDAGFTDPKPLIPVHGRPMYAWAVESLPLERATRLIFVCLESHLRDLRLLDDIRSRYARFSPEIIGIAGVTQGQACTVLEARPLIDDGTPLLVYNADTWCRTGLHERLGSIPPDVAGLLGVFRAPGDKWSFARVDETGRVVETAEKRRISDWASTGLYWFAHGREFVAHADAMVRDDDRTNGEFYVAPVYNRLIRAGRRVELDVALEVRGLGTPDELAAFTPPAGAR